jgi:hypothetical protein
VTPGDRSDSRDVVDEVAGLSDWDSRVPVRVRLCHPADEIDRQHRHRRVGIVSGCFRQADGNLAYSPFK